jgi:hypothetical protein
MRAHSCAHAALSVVVVGAEDACPFVCACGRTGMGILVPGRITGYPYDARKRPRTALTH